MRSPHAAALVGLGLLLTACPAATQIDLIVNFDADGLGGQPSQLEIFLIHGGETRGPVRAPEPARALSSGERVGVLLDPDISGVVTLSVDAFDTGSLVASGDVTADPVAGQAVVAEVELGPPLVCGDGKLRMGREACDDGNDDDEDGCTQACVAGPAVDAGPRPDAGPGPDAGRPDAGPPHDGGPRARRRWTRRRRWHGLGWWPCLRRRS